MKSAKLFGLLSAAGFLLACATGPSLTQPSDVLAFRVSPELTSAGKIEALRVEMRFCGDEDGVTAIRLQAGFDIVDDLLDNYSNVEAEGGVLKKAERPGAYTIEAPPFAPIVFSYLVHSGIEGRPSSADQQPYAPWPRPRSTGRPKAARA